VIVLRQASKQAPPRLTRGGMRQARSGCGRLAAPRGRFACNSSEKPCGYIANPRQGPDEAPASDSRTQPRRLPHKR
jgi:hypothetical protein